MSAFQRIRYRATRTNLRNPLIWLRHRGLDSKDVFIASYPRSGSTWLRFLLFEILTGNPAEFDNVNQVIPEMGLQAKALPVLPGGGRLIKTHEPYREEYKRAIYVIRDMRDVIMSQYSRDKELGLVDNDFDTYLEWFLEGKISQFGAWQKHVESWLDSPVAKCDDLLVIRFEEMRRNTEANLAEALRFLGVDANPESIRQAITNNSLEMMRAKENRALKLHRSAQEEGRFVRKGFVGGWREKLTEAQLRLIQHYAGVTLARLGYPVGGLPIESGNLQPTAPIRA